jgi:DNA-binding transcriptional LysR family regulator
VKHATLRQLKVFEAVARQLSFSRAAEELHLTQPAVSTQVKKLEDHAGLALFEQFGKKIYLTPAGAELLDISRGIIHQFELAEGAMTQFKGVAGGKLNVAVISAGDYFFPRLLVEFIGRHQGVRTSTSTTAPTAGAPDRQPHRPGGDGAAPPDTDTEASLSHRTVCVVAAATRWRARPHPPRA